MELTRIWVVPAAIFYKHAYRSSLPKGMTQFNFDCRLSGDDRWDNYEVTRQELGPRLVELITAADSRRRARVTLRGQVAGRYLQMVALAPGAAERHEKPALQEGGVLGRLVTGAAPVVRIL